MAEPALDRAALTATANRRLDRLGADAVSGAMIAELTADEGVDVATAVLHEHFRRRLIATVGSAPGPAGADPESRSVARPGADRPRLAVVPGAFYRERPEIGADGQRLIDLASDRGWRIDRIDTESLGSIEANTEIVAAWLRAAGDDPVVLIPISRGTLEAVAALDRADGSTNVRGLVNLSGLGFGSPVVDWLARRRWSRLGVELTARARRIDADAIWRLGARSRSPFGHYPFPIYHLAGFPLEGDLSSRRARLWHRRLRRAGPTDSVMMLADLLKVDGHVVPVLGADHYLRTAEVEDRVLPWVLDRLSIDADDEPG